MLLSKVVLGSVSAAAFLLAGSIAHGDEMQMKGDALFAAIADHEVHAVTSKGKTWSAVFKADGTVKYSAGGMGTWRVDDDQFCDFPKGDKEYCGTVFSLGNGKYQTYRPDGSKVAVWTIQ